MPLTQFGLWARHLSKEMSAQLKDEQRCVIALYEKYFPGLKTSEVFKVLVDVVEVVEKPQVDIAAGVAFAEVAFDLRKYFDSESAEKKRIVLELLQKGVRRASSQLGWPQDPFERAYAKVRELDYKNEWTWHTKRWNSSKMCRAEVFCVHEIDRFEAYMIIRDKDQQEVKRELLFSERPNEFQFADHFGKLTWTSGTTVELVSKNGDRRWTVEIDELSK